MDLDWLRDFLALAQHGNFSRAADARFVTQPAFSRRVRALEDWVGTPLFDRTPQGAALTTAGQAFHPLALDLLRDLDRARRATLAAAECQTTSLAIAATHALSFTFFPSWIGRNADIATFGKLGLMSDTLEACEQAMLSGEVHFLLCHWHENMRLALHPEHHESVGVGRDVLVAVCAPDRTGRPLWPLTGIEPRPTKLLGYNPESGLGRILVASPKSRIGVESAEPVITSHLAATLLALARDGQGAAWLPLTMVEEDLRRATLVRAGVEMTDIDMEIRLFRSPSCRNRAADELWRRLQASS